MFKFHYLITLVFCFLVQDAMCSASFYSVVAPGTLRPKSEYNVAVSLHKSPNPVELKIGIIGPTLEEYQVAKLEPYSTEILQFKIPNIKNGDYNLTVVDLSDQGIKNETTLQFDQKHNSILIQTDKAIYKPGDLVRYRVLILDPNTKPAKLDGPVIISINDGKQNTIRQVKSAKFIGGVHTDELQLSELPVLGDWKITVEFDEETNIKHFEVAEYVLPRFEVTIDTPKDISRKNGKIYAIVRAKYTFGTPVKGEAYVTIDSYGDYESKKTSPLDGKAVIEFDLDDEVMKNTYYSKTFKLTAVVKEGLTGKTQNSTTEVTVHENEYELSGHKIPNYFEPDIPFTVVVKATHVDKTPIQDTENNVTISFQSGYGKEKTSSNFTTKFDKNGFAKFDVVLPQNETNYYSISGEYLDVKSAYIGSISVREKKPAASFEIEILTEKPSLGKNVSIEVNSNKKMQYFIYQIIGRGNIIKSDIVKVDDQNVYSFDFIPTFSMVPKAEIYVYLIRDGELIYKEKSIEFTNNLENFIEIDGKKLAKPGEDVEIEIKTNSDSYVGLLGVDQSVLLLKSGNDISNDIVFNELREYRSSTPHSYDFYHYPGQSSGVVTLTNSNYEADNYIRRHLVYYSPSKRLNGAKPTVTVRNDFPESWIWNDIKDLGTKGELTLHKKVPDTITSWVVTGFSLNAETGLGLTLDPYKIRVFQPFFVTTNLPYSVVRGEVVSISALVFNNMEKNLDVEVTLDNEANDFDFVELSNEITDDSVHEKNRTKRTVVKANAAESVSFMIRPKKVGLITVKIQAISPLAGDAFEKPLKVKAEGTTMYMNKAVLINLSKNTTQDHELKCDIPEDIVKDSIYTEASVVGDILAPTIKNLHKLVRLPYGCGEQNMVNFVPNILVLKYLKMNNKQLPEVETKARDFMQVGYQRELTYKHDNGSYSAFGKRDKSGSTWLTAYVARSFRQAAEFITVDEGVIESALKFLASIQADNGSFQEVGQVIDQHHDAKTDKGIVLTAFTVLAFKENLERFPSYKENIDKGLAYIEQNLKAIENNVYPLAVASYTLQLTNHSAKDEALKNLQNLAKSDADRKWWSEPETKTQMKNKPAYFYRPPSVNVEITAYALLAHLAAGLESETLPIAKWLISQRNSQGGFESTQDTVVGLQALTQFAENLPSINGEMEIKLKYGADHENKFIINDENAAILETLILPSSTQSMTVSASGNRSALVQLSCQYNVHQVEPDASFVVDAKAETVEETNNIKISTRLSYVSKNGEPKSNMAVMELSLPSGYTVDMESLNKLVGTDNIKKVESKDGDTVAVIYFDSLTPEIINPEIQAYKMHKIAEQKPASIKVYDYYNNEHQARIYYDAPETTLLDICEGDDCGLSTEKTEAK